MSARAGRRRYRRGLVAICCLYALSAGLSSPTPASAGDQDDVAGKSARSDGSAPAAPAPAAASPRWTFSAEAIGLARSGGVNQTLVARVPGNVPFYAYSARQLDSATFPGVEALNANQYRQGFSAGPKLSLTYHDGSGYGFQLSYFDVLGLSGAKAIGPDYPADWLVMKAPGSFWQTQDYPYQAMSWTDSTSFYGVEANGQLDVAPHVTILAGFRWLRLNDELQGTLTPVDLGEPSWKAEYPSPTLRQVRNPSPGTPVAINPPFWTTRTTNNLYGLQVGVEGKIWELGRLSFDGAIKAGVYDNSAGQSAQVSMAKQLYPAQATTNAVAFAAEADLNTRIQLADGFALKAGYEALWLDGVALAPGQIRETYTTSPSPSSPSTPISASALGVNHRASALFQGATFGLEYSF
jgi:hypothetical protein